MRRLCFLLPLFLVFVRCSVADARDGASSYVRVANDGKGQPRTLQTEIAHFVLAAGQKVDLVAAVHLGERDYYRGLNERFKQYDAVLYEMVIDGAAGRPTGGIVIPRDGDNASVVSRLQLYLCRLLGLQFQLYAIDYAAPNFRHADLTMAEFRAAMRNNGESLMTLLMKIFQIALQDADNTDQELQQIDLLALLYREPTPAEQMALRRAFAHSFTQVEQLTAELQGTTLIAGRNRRALQTLDEQLRAGKRNLAVFYGAGHMVDLETQLMKLPGARLQGREWLDAWRLR